MNTATNAGIATSHTVPDPRLDLWLRRSVWIGCALLLLVPAARGHSAWFGWLPLWMLGMPLTAWWALHRFRLPRWPATQVTALPFQRRRRGAQARRRSLPLLARRLPHAA